MKNVYRQIGTLYTVEKMCTVKIMKSMLIALDMLLKMQRVEIGHHPASVMVRRGGSYEGGTRLYLLRAGTENTSDQLPN